MSFPPQTGFLTSRLYPFINKSVSIRDGTCKKVSFAVTAKVDQRLCFRHLDTLCFLNPKFRVSSHLLWLYSLVCGNSPIIFHAVSLNSWQWRRVAEMLKWYKGQEHLSKWASFRSRGSFFAHELWGWRIRLHMSKNSPIAKLLPIAKNSPRHKPTHTFSYMQMSSEK